MAAASVTPVAAATDALLNRFAKDVAFVAEEQPAITIVSFADQLYVAAEHFEGAGINGRDDLEAAARYLVDSEAATSKKRRAVLFSQALGHLTDLGDMVDDYRLML